jgi:hypothetical protein
VIGREERPHPHPPPHAEARSLGLGRMRHESDGLCRFASHTHECGLSPLRAAWPYHATQVASKLMSPQEHRPTGATSGSSLQTTSHSTDAEPAWVP